MKTKYTITVEQLETLDHYKRMFEMEADRIKGLCSSEKDDIVYGFELGEMHSHLRECFLRMSDLSESIKNNKI
jgi:hypothetical protein